MERLLSCKNVRALGILRDEVYGDMPCFELEDMGMEEWNRLARSRFRQFCIDQYGREPDDLEAAFRENERRLRAL